VSCRIDNGRAFLQAAKPPGTDWTIVQFWDLKVYRVSPLDDAWLLANTGPHDQPACYFNHEQWHDPLYRFRRLSKWPKIPAHWHHIIWRK